MPIENDKKYKLAVVVSHPIQYQAPFFQLLSKCPELDLKVFFCSKWGLKEYYDEGFGEKIKWDIPLLDGYDFEFLPNISPLKNPSKFFGLINPLVINKLKSRDFNAVWIHGWANLTNWIVILAALSFKIPILLRGESNLFNKGSPLKSFFKRIVLKWLFKRISGFLAIGKYNAEFYRSYGISSEKIFLVPYTVNNDYFLRKAEELVLKKKELKEKYKIPKELPVILYSGKLIDVKRPMDLLKAFEVVSKDCKAALVFVGDGKLKKQLEASANKNKIKNVFFMGFKNQTELPEFYAMSDVFVLPSSHEPWGLVVNEAMCFSLPVIVSDKVGAGGDLVREGLNGFIYSAKDVISLSNYLHNLLANETKRKSMSEMSLRIISSWSYNKCVEGISNCMQAISNSYR